MLIAIISDIHDNLANLQTCLSWCRVNKIHKIICCGDVCNDDTLIYLSRNFKDEISLVDGNGELFTAKNVSNLANINYHREIGFEIIDKLNIGFCHQERDFDKVIKKAGNIPDFLFYGHSHKPWLEKRGAMFVCNPGNVAATFYPATFATLDTKTRRLELEIIDNLS